MKIAILTRPDFRSPRVLAESLKEQLENQKVYVEIFYDINLLTRLVGYRESKLSFHFWLKEKLVFYLKDRNVLQRLGKFDAILISECTPNGFRKSMYNVERLRYILKKRVLYYEVYYLGNAPSQIELLTTCRDSLFDRYDFHLSVAEITEIRQRPSGNWFSIGIFAKSLKLLPKPKNDIIAIVDFVQPGYEAYRELQIRALNKAGIKYISLGGKYSFEEIRKIYQEGAIFFVQFPEAFGLPVLECLCCGNQVFTPSSDWLMAWRLNDPYVIWNKEILANCFSVYSDENDLVNKLLQFKNNYHLTETPKKIFQDFVENYSCYYHGNEQELSRLLNTLNKVISND